MHQSILDSLENVLAVAGFDAASLRTVVCEGLEQPFRLVLVLQDTPEGLNLTNAIMIRLQELLTFPSARPPGPMLPREGRQRPWLSSSSKPFCL